MAGPYYQLQIDYKKKVAYVILYKNKLSKEFKDAAASVSGENAIFEFENVFYSCSRESLKKKELEIKKQWRRNYLIAILDHYCQQRKYRHRVDISASGSIYYIYYIYGRTLIKVRISDHEPKENCAHLYLRTDEDLNKLNKNIRSMLLRTLSEIEKKVKKRERDFLLLKLGNDT